jgi:hypothetical protein
MSDFVTALPHIQKDIVIKTAPTQSSLELVQRAIAYIQKYGAPTLPVESYEQWDDQP